jgi:hypothetical protein
VADPADDRVAALTVELEAAEAERLKLAEDLEMEKLLGPDGYRARLAKWAGEVERLNAEIQEASKVLVASEAIDAALIASMQGGDPDPAALQHAVTQLIERIDVSRGDGPLEDRVSVVFR